MLRVPRFGEYFDYTGPRRVAPGAGFAPTMATLCHPWAWLLVFDNNGPTGRTAEIGTDMIIGACGVDLNREPGDLGLDDCKSDGKRLLYGLPFADTVEPEDDRILTVDDLLPFGSE